MTLSRTLAEFAAGPVTPSNLAAQVASLSALDWLAVGRAGADERVSKITRDMVLAEGGTAQAALFGSEVRVPLRAAALVNGTTSHALDYDDTHFAHIGHPSVAVFPAALAMAEQTACSVSDMVQAALIGMELSVRVGLWLGRAHYQAGFHQTATAGAFGATAAAGRLAGFDADAMAQALGLVATRAAGLKAQFGTMGKPLNAGLAASAGVEAALLVERGFQSNPGAMEGPFGFGASHHGEGASAVALDGLGDTWLFEDVRHKFHACCHGLHAALEAARDLDIAAPQIAELTVETHPRWMSVCNKQRPATGLGAKFSYGTVLAMQALGHDTAQPASFTDAICTDPHLAELRDRISVVENPELTETEAVLHVLRRDGARREARHDLLQAIALNERIARVSEKAGKLMGVQRAEDVRVLLAGDGPVSGFSRHLAG